MKLFKILALYFIMLKNEHCKHLKHREYRKHRKHCEHRKIFKVCLAILQPFEIKG